MTRHEAREQAFIFIFEKAFNNEYEMEEIIKTAEEARLIEPDDFAVKTATVLYDNVDEVDFLIESAAIGWHKERMPKVTLSILRLAVCEMKYFEDIPVGVSINEAVELAKIYATQEDASYINGILGTVSKTLAQDNKES